MTEIGNLDMENKNTQYVSLLTMRCDDVCLFLCVCAASGRHARAHYCLRTLENINIQIIGKRYEHDILFG